MGERVLGVIDGVVTGTARAITRRRLLRNSGGAALGFALATAYSGSQAFANADEACAPSPMCPGVRCQGWKCDGGRTDTTWRQHGQAKCGTAGAAYNDNCWLANDSAGTRFRCCDCCAQDAPIGTNHCDECPGDDTRWKKCICGAPF